MSSTAHLSASVVAVALSCDDDMKLQFYGDCVPSGGPFPLSFDAKGAASFYVSQIAFTGDLFLQPGHLDAIIRDDRSSLSVQLYRTFYGTPPEVPLQRVLDRVEASAPTLLAPGHGSVLAGNLAPYYRAYRQSVSALAALRPLAEGTRPRRSVDDDASPRAPSLNRERD